MLHDWFERKCGLNNIIIRQINAVSILYTVIVYGFTLFMRNRE